MALAIPHGLSLSPSDGSGLGLPTYQPVAQLQDPQLAPATSLDQVPVPAPTPAPKAAPAAAPAVVAAVVSGCGDNFYANYIYMHESGCNTGAVNPIGACGIGQALPCSKMGCSLADYACQNNYFTGYATSTYGGWAGAYNHWLEYSWW